MAKSVYDLTEAFLAATGKYPHYGIVRVVEEIGRELCLIDPDLRFGIFSHAHDRFFELRPRVIAETGAETGAKTGQVDLNIPAGVRQIHHLRRRFYSENRLRDALLPLAHGVVRAINRSRWRRAALSLPVLDMTGATLVSAGRPKHMVAALDALDAAGTDYRFVPLLHDMFPLHDAGARAAGSFQAHFIGDNARVIRRASRIIANSRFTRAEIERFSRAGILPPVPEIVAVPLVQQCRPGTGPARGDLPAGPYLLTVGATIGRKNLEVVFEALRLLEQSGAPVPRLVLAGAPRKHVRAYLDDTRYDGIRPFIERVINPSHATLAALYRNAMALVLPSRLEGWGLPAGEALWTGTPAICSTAPVLSEVCGDLGLYFDPDSPAELAGLIVRLQTDPAFARALRARIAAAAPGLRTWADVAADIRRVYEG